jgi:probable phosphoglycerate mutase
LTDSADSETPVPCRLLLVAAGPVRDPQGGRLAEALGGIPLDAVVCASSGAAAGSVDALTAGRGLVAEIEPAFDQTDAACSDALRRLATAYQDATVLLVADRAVLRLLAALVTDCDPAGAGSVEPDAALTVLEVEPGGKGVLHVLNWDLAPQVLDPPAADRCRVLLIRHGQSMVVEDGAQVWSHHPIGLTSRGREQAAVAAVALRDLPLVAIYASDLERAKETAEAISNPHGLTPIVDSGLREVGLGRFEGMTLERVHSDGDARFLPWLEVTFNERFPHAEFHHPVDLTFPEGESIGSVHERARATLAAIVAAHLGETVAVVSHTWVIQPLLAVLGGGRPEGYFRFSMRYATTTLVDVAREGRGQLQIVNGGLDLHEVAGGRLLGDRRRAASGETTRVGRGVA